MQVYRPAIRLFLGFLLVLSIGTGGYMILEEWTALDSLYMTIITITTIGFGEVRNLSPEGRLFTIFVIFLGLGLAAALFARLGQLIVESGLSDAYGRRRMTDRIKRMRNHYLICGFGRIGSSIARKLDESGIAFVVVDSRDEHISSARELGYNALQGDASNDAILQNAGIQRAAGTVLCVGDDATNVNIALAARELNGEQNIISRGTDPSVEYRLIRAGADTVVFPMRLGGEQIARAIVDRYMKESDKERGTSSSMLGYELRVIRVTENSTVGDIGMYHRALRPVAVRRAGGDMVHNPKPDEPVGENDSVLLLVHEEKQNRIPHDVPLLSWSDDMSTGIAKLDKEHKRLYKILEDFQNAVLDGLGRDEVAKRYEMFAAYVGSHFLREEVIMRENGYPGQEEHQLLHEELTRLILDMNKDERYVFPDETWTRLDRALSRHFLEADSSLADYLKEK